MIEHAAYRIDPWRVIEDDINMDFLAQSESVFALSNGHIGLRGNLDEGEPHGIPGTYLGSYYETHPLPSAELTYGQPESGQTIVNVTNGKLIRLFVNDEPFDVRYGRLISHQRVLDLRAGTLDREVQWESPGRRTVKVHTTRMVSLVQRAAAAILYEVEPVDEEVRVVIQSELVANEKVPETTGDPRKAAALDCPLVSEDFTSADSKCLLTHRTRSSGLHMAAMMDHHWVEMPEDHEIRTEAWEDLARVSVIATLRPGVRLRFVKYLAYGWSSTRTVPALRDQVAGAVLAATHSGFNGLLRAQREYLDDFWDRADVEVDGDEEVQQAVRFALWQVLQAGARAETRALPAKGLTGPGYDGHAFWDTETFVLPVLTYTVPTAAADALRWRHSTLPLAQARAAQLSFVGATFPWRTIAGEECSGYWPASTAAFHINADIADAVIRYFEATRDSVFMEEVGGDLLVQTARLWCSLGHYDDGRGFRIDGVTGPDEYSAVADNNLFTNLMAARNLRAAAVTCQRYPAVVEALGVSDEEIRGWLDAADAMVIPYDEDLGVHSQADDFTRHQRWDFEHTKRSDYPLLLHATYFDLYRKQVVKQADLVLAMHLCGEEFTAEQKAKNFTYYEAITVRDSSLSACTQAVVAAEVGHLGLAYQYLREAALMDLDDLEHNTPDGLHIASLSGSWMALVAGFGGLRERSPHPGLEPDVDAYLAFRPRLPAVLRRLTFRLVYRDERLRVTVTPKEARYELEGEHPLMLEHHGEPFQLRPGRPARKAIPPIDPGPLPTQPPGREPGRLALSSG
jgi:alpha,alpha-trehalose phosphorylase